MKIYSTYQKDNLIFRFVDFPNGLNALISRDANGDYNIYVSVGLSSSEKHKAINHELAHAGLGHFDEEDFRKIEEEARAYESSNLRPIQLRPTNRAKH